MSRICIYCKAALTPMTRKAHVWPASMGGRLAPRDTNCDDCNNALGPVEDTLRASLAHAYAAVGAVNDKRKPIEVVVELFGRDFRLADGNAMMATEGRRFDRETKSFIVPLPAGFDNQVEALAKAMLSHGLGPDDVGKLELTPGDPEPQLPSGPTAHEYDLKLGSSVEHKRVFVKMALELLAAHRHDLATRGELSEARRFARRGDGSLRGKPDTRSSGSGLLAAASLTDVYNAIEVWSHGRAVFFRVVFLGPLVFTGTLTTDWSGDPFRAVYAFDARNPGASIANGLETSDGPNLAIWIEGMAEETVEQATAALEEMSRRLASSKAPVQREEPPELEKLRAAVKERIAALRQRGRSK